MIFPLIAQTAAPIFDEKALSQGLQITNLALLYIGVSVAVYLVLLVVGRLIKRRLGVPLGWSYQTFCFAMALFVPSALPQFQFDAEKHIDAAAVLTGAFVAISFVRHYIFETRTRQDNATVPKFVSQLVSILIFLAAVAVVAMVVLLIVGHVLAAIGPKPEPHDERDRVISWRSEYRSSWIIATGVLSGVAAMALGVENVWTANLLLLSLAVAEIVGLVLRIEALTGKRKLSQNRAAADRDGAQAALAVCFTWVGCLLSTLPATPVPATVETPVEAPPPGASDTARTLCPLAESTT
jgi:MFS family permease